MVSVLSMVRRSRSCVISSAPGWSKRSTARTLSAIRSFYRYLHRNEIVDSNPARAVGAPKLEKYLPGYLDRTQVDLILLATCENDLGDLGWNRLTLDAGRLPVRVEATRRMIDPKGRMHYVNEGRVALPALAFPGQRWLEDHSLLYHFLRLRLTKLSAAWSARIDRPAPPEGLRLEG